MKKFAVMAVAAGMFSLTACKEAPPVAGPPTEEPTPTNPDKEPRAQPCTGPDGRLEGNCKIP